MLQGTQPMLVPILKLVPEERGYEAMFRRSIGHGNRHPSRQPCRTPASAASVLQSHSQNLKACNMTRRVLYIVAYDVSEPSRLRKVHHVIKRFATGGQKSVFECFLTSRERDELLADARAILDEDVDRLALFRVEERARPMLLGIATPADDPDFFYVG